MQWSYVDGLITTAEGHDGSLGARNAAIALWLLGDEVAKRVLAAMRAEPSKLRAIVTHLAALGSVDPNTRERFAAALSADAFGTAINASDGGVFADNALSQCLPAESEYVQSLLTKASVLGKTSPIETELQK